MFYSPPRRPPNRNQIDLIPEEDEINLENQNNSDETNNRGEASMSPIANEASNGVNVGNQSINNASNQVVTRPLTGRGRGRTTPSPDFHGFPPQSGCNILGTRTITPPVNINPLPVITNQLSVNTVSPTSNSVPLVTNTSQSSTRMTPIATSTGLPLFNAHHTLLNPLPTSSGFTFPPQGHLDTTITRVSRIESHIGDVRD